MRGDNLPPHPKPPAGSEPAMQVQVPSERLTAQWNLGAWHLVRHCEKNPKNGRLWFNDYPYGILAAETYMILAALDLMGSHQAAEDGLDQWTSLPMDPSSAPGHHEWALPDRPSGLFSEGHGCLTHAVGPPGAGGHMDGIHAFGPGSIGWALDRTLLADRRRQVAESRRAADQGQRPVDAAAAAGDAKHMVPGGERLWCKGLQPALSADPGQRRFVDAVSTNARPTTGSSLSRFADTLSTIDPEGGAKLKAEAEAYRKICWRRSSGPSPSRRWCRSATAPSIRSFRSPVTCAG